MIGFEYPPGSGRLALYDEDEAALVRAIVRTLERGAVTPAEFRRQVEIIHDAKMLGHRIGPAPAG